MVAENTRATLERWAGRLESLGLAGVAGALLNAFRPFAPVGAGVLTVTQPVLGALVGWERVTGWANLLEDPEALTWLGRRLDGEETDADER